MNKSRRNFIRKFLAAAAGAGMGTKTYLGLDPLLDEKRQAIKGKLDENSGNISASDIAVLKDDVEELYLRGKWGGTILNGAITAVAVHELVKYQETAKDARAENKELAAQIEAAFFKPYLDALMEFDAADEAVTAARKDVHDKLVENLGADPQRVDQYLDDLARVVKKYKESNKSHNNGKAQPGYDM